MRKTLFVHIGWPKTGTSTLQVFLDINREAFMERGLLYPDTGTFGPAHHVLAHLGYSRARLTTTPNVSQIEIDNRAVSIAAMSDEDRLNIFKDTLVVLINECRDSACHQSLIASEAFSNWEEESIQVFIETVKSLDFDVRVIANIRRQDELLESLIAQNEKATLSRINEVNSIRALVESNAFDYHQTLNFWARHIGWRNIMLKPYATLRKNRGLISDLLQTLDITDHDSFYRPANLNVSLTRDTLEFLINCANDGMDSDELSRLESVLLDYVENHPESSHWRYRLAPGERQKIIDQYKASNLKLAISTLSAVNIIFDEPAVSFEAAWEEYPGVSDDTRASIIEYLDTRKKEERIASAMPD